VLDVSFWGLFWGWGAVCVCGGGEQGGLRVSDRGRACCRRPRKCARNQRAHTHHITPPRWPTTSPRPSSCRPARSSTSRTGPSTTGGRFALFFRARERGGSTPHATMRVGVAASQTRTHKSLNHLLLHRPRSPPPQALLHRQRQAGGAGLEGVGWLGGGAAQVGGFSTSAWKVSLEGGGLPPFSQADQPIATDCKPPPTANQLQLTAPNRQNNRRPPGPSTGTSTRRARTTGRATWRRRCGRTRCWWGRASRGTPRA
jgi:hypothetical protein